MDLDERHSTGCIYPFRSQTVANLQPYCMDRKSAK